MINAFNWFLIGMAAIAVVVFVALFFVNAGYGKFYEPKWGPSLDNHWGWFLMEVPVFVAMLVLWWLSDRRASSIRLVFLLLFELHYFHRSFIFPLQLRGHSRMPLAIVLMGALFNTLNALMQGGWIFYFSPADYYPEDWLVSLPFLAGTVLFFSGMYVNIQSDRIIRHLRKPGDTAHYLPRGGMFRCGGCCISVRFVYSGCREDCRSAHDRGKQPDQATRQADNGKDAEKGDPTLDRFQIIARFRQNL